MAKDARPSVCADYIFTKGKRKYYTQITSMLSACMRRLKAHTMHYGKYVPMLIIST